MLNAITQRNANLPPSMNKFFEEFAKYHIVSLVNLYSEYD